MTVVRLQGIDFRYERSVPLFHDLNLELRAGQDVDGGHVYAVMGASGSGKTTLFRLITGLACPQRGEIEVEADGESPVFSYLPQKAVMFEHLSRMNNARYFARLRATNERFDDELFERMITQLRLRHVLSSDSAVSLMSGGEMQRLSLLRAISIRPHVLLLDEPCTGLDVPVRDEFLIALREITDGYKLLVLYITHHADEARLVADRVVFLSRNGEGVTATQASLKAFVEAPPSVAAAQMTADTPLNVVSCRVETSETLIWEGAEIRYASDAPVPPGEYRLVFRPGSVHWSDAGVPARLVSESGRYAFLCPNHEPSVRLVASNHETRGHAVSLAGDALLYSTSTNRGGIRARLISTKDLE